MTRFGTRRTRHRRPRRVMAPYEVREWVPSRRVRVDDALLDTKHLRRVFEYGADEERLDLEPVVLRLGDAAKLRTL